MTVTKQSEVVGVLKNRDGITVTEREPVETLDEGTLKACRKALDEE